MRKLDQQTYLIHLTWPLHTCRNPVDLSRIQYGFYPPVWVLFKLPIGLIWPSDDGALLKYQLWGSALAKLLDLLSSSTPPPPPAPRRNSPMHKNHIYSYTFLSLGQIVDPQVNKSQLLACHFSDTSNSKCLMPNLSSLPHWTPSPNQENSNSNVISTTHVVQYPPFSNSLNKNVNMPDTTDKVTKMFLSLMKFA